MSVHVDKSNSVNRQMQTRASDYAFFEVSFQPVAKNSLQRTAEKPAKKNGSFY